MKAKVFIIIDNLSVGGAQRQIIEYLKYADRDKFNIKIINLDKKINILSNEIEKLGFSVIGIKHSGFINLSTIIKLRRLFKKEKPNIVHTYLFTSDCYGRLAAKIAGIKVIISSVRNVDSWKQWHHILIDRILERFTDKIIINAESIGPYLVNKEKLNSDKIINIYNGIDLKRFVNLQDKYDTKKRLNIPEDSLVVGMVSRFSDQKDYKTFFLAAEQVITKLPKVHFIAIGDGPLKASLQSMVNTRGLKDKFIFTGLRNDIPGLINMMDICILASHYEGCPNVILEYMACSKPVITSGVGGCSELVVDGKTGFIIPPKSPEALAQKIIQLLNDGELSRKMGVAGRRRLEENFISEIMVKKTEQLYGELLKPKIAFIISQFPETHETFILREIKALEERRVNFKILSLKPCRDNVIHKEAEELIRQTIYGKAFSSELIAHSLLHPISTISSFFYVVKSYLNNPEDLIKAMYVWLGCLYLARIIKKEKISHIHSHWATMPTTAAVILNKLTGVSFSFTAHAWDIFVNSNGLAGKIKRSKFVITCTEYNRKYLESLVSALASWRVNGLKAKIYRNYHGIDLSKFSTREHENALTRKLTILSIGRLVETKGFEYLIEACRILRDKGIDFECSIVGSGPLEKTLKLRATTYDLRAKISFLGILTQEEIKKLYSEATVLVQPSVLAKNGDRDGVPNVILEAMAMAVPVIATDFSGIPEAIIDRQTGVLVPEKDSSALADAIEELWRNTSLRQKLIKNGRQLVEEKFNIEKNIAELTNIFQENEVLI